jgi:hypothetical protein
MKWWVDDFFAVHDNMQSHKRSTISMGTGSIFSTSIKKKLNTRSSTAGHAAMDDMIPEILWTIYFLKNQGFNVGPTGILQDSKSAILLKKNMMASSSQRTHHIHIRFYVITNQIIMHKVSVEHFPTMSRVSSFVTKPLQGPTFYEFRKFTM